jgi:hypothetical protein
MRATTRTAGLLSLLLTSVALAGCDKSSMGPEPEPEAYTWVGLYATGQKWGGATGTWRATGNLELTADRRVFVGATEIMNPQVGENTVSWSMADGNGTNAAFELMTSSTSTYFWGDTGAAGQLFQGWIQYPQEGKLDYRGRVN